MKHLYADARLGYNDGFSEQWIETSSSTKSWEFLDHPSYWVKDFVV